ncbi:MAG: type 1 glutamine amidotransferase [Clostridia bacterium]|nr:type 1 glutamine amidotransferase [Clostridia bacterium]
MIAFCDIMTKNSICFVGNAIGRPARKEEIMSVTKKILMITYDGCDDAEVLYPIYRLREAGFETVIASLEARTLTAKYHYTFDATLTPEEIVPEEYDGLLLPGGSAPEKLRVNPLIIKAVRAFFTADKPVGAICHGPQILISSGDIKNRRCTCYPGIRDDVILAGGCYESVSAAADRNLVTSRKPDDLPDFMHEFCRLLDEYTAAENAKEEQAARETAE